MSNDVYGFVATQHPNETRAFLEAAASRRNIGVKFIMADELFNFPPEVLPTGNHVAFVVGDRGGKESADYLTDMVDYAPGALEGLSASGEQRLSLLVDWIEEIGRHRATEWIYIAMTECSEIESHERVGLDGLRGQLMSDFRQHAPPNRLYVVSA
ncbi:hypothetical protein [Polyangium sorediatum]|uniref:Uncharacterized protein n=1 Tax=Polyangium sorediatum TaxID=889274 RepID=A0ABT6P2X8_9BACT|nr:hypothetical protein [Polyangium sorediatum]MDI1434918.1 hypothetical protein [Polyangium sorediatum]